MVISLLGINKFCMLKKHRKFLATYITAFFIFVFVSVYLTFPLVLHMGDMITGYGDEFVIAWIQNWVIHSLSTNPLSIWNTNTYFPYPNTWAYSDLLITSSILAIIPLHIIGQPIATFNFTVISSFVLVGFSIFLLCYYLTKDFFASLFAGILVIFSPALIQYNVHAQMLASEWIPLSILSFLVFIKRKKTRYLILSMFFFVIQSYNSLMPGYFLIFFYLVYGIYFWFKERKTLALFLIRRNLIVICLAIIAIIPIIIPYYQVSHEFNYVRPLTDTIHFALQPEDFIYPNQYTRFEPYLLAFSDMHHYQSISGEMKGGFLGLIFSVLAIGVIIYFVKNWKRSKPLFNIFMITGLLGFILSLGPFLHFNRVTIHHPFPIPLPYVLFYYIFPGFQAFRDSERWEVLFILCASIGICLMLTSLLKRYDLRWRTLIYLALTIAVMLEFNFPIKYMSVTQKQQFPSLYTWLQTIPQNTSIIILPMYNWNMSGASVEMRREYYSTIEFRPMANGYSGFSPPPWQNFISMLQKNFPDEQSLKQIQALDIKEVIIDKDQYDSDYKNHLSSANGSTVINKLLHNHSLKLVKTVGHFYIFQVISNTNK